MAEYTQNYNLKKPGQDDFYNIEDSNANMDTIDAKIKEAVDKAGQAFQQANNGKTDIATVIGSPVTAGDTFSQIKTKIQTIKDTMAANLTTKGITAVASETLTALVNKISDIVRGSGNALPAHVLSGKTFSNDSGPGQVGTMADNGPASTTTVTLANNNDSYVIPAGYHSGLRTVKAVIINLAAAVIKAGTTVGGIAGTFTSDATAAAAQILSGITAYVDGNKITGTMANNGAVTITPGTTNKAIATGYHSGSGYVAGDADLVTANIKAGANIFGVAGKASIVETSDATATAAQVRNGQTAYVNGSKLTGTLAVQATSAQTITPGTANIIKSAGIYDGSITVLGDVDLVTANIKSGANIFGVSGKASVVETSDAIATAAQIRSGQTAYVNGAKVTGTLAVQATAAQTVTPGAANIVKAAGIYDGAITVAGDTNLIASNIISGKSVFGVSGTAIPKTIERRWASGSGVTNTTTGAYTVTGLAFTPKIVIIRFNSSDTSGSFGVKCLTDGTGLTVSYLTNALANPHIYYVDTGVRASSELIFTTNGFSGAYVSKSMPYYWIAIE